jgi:transposase
LSDALQLKRELVPEDYLRPIEKRNALKQTLDGLLNMEINPKHEKLTVFKNRMINRSQHLLTFLYRPDVPPDNNGSERAVRTFKVKQKVSGLFRSNEGAQSFAVIRSVIDTAIKNSQNVFHALACIAAAE